MEVRTLTPEDAADIARLWHAGALDSGEAEPRFMPRIGAGDYAGRIGQQLENGERFGWGVAGEDGRLVAYLTARIEKASSDWSKDAYLCVLDVDVQADQRQRGHVRRLLAAAQAHAKGEGLTRIELSWIANDARADAVWTKLGFRPFIKVGYIDLAEAAGEAG